MSKHFDPFDLNGDGEVSLFEDLFLLNAWDHYRKKEEKENKNERWNGREDEWRDYCEDGSEYEIDPDDYETEEEYEEALEEAKFGWRDLCEDGSEYDIDPDDYETEAEYEEALEEAKYAWRNNYKDGLDYGVDPRDYEDEEDFCADFAEAKELADFNDLKKKGIDRFPNKRRHEAACYLADPDYKDIRDPYYDEWRERCEFILYYGDTIPAANYLTPYGEFLYAQAVKEHFDLPCTFTDEDLSQRTKFYRVLLKISKKDIPLSLEVWSWCLDHFLPFSHYGDAQEDDMSEAVIDKLHDFSGKFRKKLICYMGEHPGFLDTMMRAGDEPFVFLDVLVGDAIKAGSFTTASILFEEGLKRGGSRCSDVIDLVDDTISDCETFNEVESIEYFRDHLLPMVKKDKRKTVLNKIEGWKKRIEIYIDEVVSEDEKYAYSGKNAWRNTAPDGKEYGLDPVDYDTEREYPDALTEWKYMWRESCRDGSEYGIDPMDYETEEEYNEILTEKIRERMRKKDELFREAVCSAPKDAVYTICAVSVASGSSRFYYYLAEDLSLDIGDTVIVPFGAKNSETEGQVVSVGRYLRSAAPYPPENAKKILRKVKKK